MRKWIEPALGVMAVVTIPVIGVLGMQAFDHQGPSVSSEVKSHHVTGACNCGCCQQLNVSGSQEFSS